MLRKCRFCYQTKRYKHWRQFAAHSSSCKFNPNYERRRQKIIKSLRHPEFEFKFNCKKCQKKKLAEAKKNDEKNLRSNIHTGN